MGERLWMLETPQGSTMGTASQTRGEEERRKVIFALESTFAGQKAMLQVHLTQESIKCLVALCSMEV